MNKTETGNSRGGEEYAEKTRIKSLKALGFAPAAVGAAPAEAKPASKKRYRG